MTKNDKAIITIEDMSHEGMGIGHVDGMTIFVKDAVPGDEVEAVIVKEKKTYCFARLLKVINPSAYRVEPKCPVSKQCGGCSMQQYDYKMQLKLKEDIVINNLCRIGGFDRQLILEKYDGIMGMDEPYRYRNKASVPVGYDKDGNILMGFYGARSHRIVEVDDCAIGQKANGPILATIKAFMQYNNIPAYDEETGKGLVRHILIREAMATGEIMVTLVINGSRFPEAKKLSESLLSVEPRIASICINSNTRRDNVILGTSTRCIWGNEYITDTIDVGNGPVAFHISPNSFYQVNHDQMERLYAKALSYADLKGTESVWDLYCGIGTISLCLAANAGKVYGVEVVPQAIENAKANAVLNNLSNTEFFLGKAEEVLPDFYAKNKADGMSSPDVIVVDPPRAGCDSACLDTMLMMKPQRIVYVSCDSATLARDLKLLCEKDYELEAFSICDQFCHSMHVETVCLLSKLREAKNHVRVKLDMDDID